LCDLAVSACAVSRCNSRRARRDWKALRGAWRAKPRGGVAELNKGSVHFSGKSFYHDTHIFHSGLGSIAGLCDVLHNGELVTRRQTTTANVDANRKEHTPAPEPDVRAELAGRAVGPCGWPDLRPTKRVWGSHAGGACGGGRLHPLQCFLHSCFHPIGFPKDHGCVHRGYRSLKSLVCEQPSSAGRRCVPLGASPWTEYPSKKPYKPPAVGRWGCPPDCLGVPPGAKCLLCLAYLTLRSRDRNAGIPLCQF